MTFESMSNISKPQHELSNTVVDSYEPMQPPFSLETPNAVRSVA